MLIAVPDNFNHIAWCFSTSTLFFFLCDFYILSYSKFSWKVCMMGQMRVHCDLPQLSWFIGHPVWGWVFFWVAAVILFYLEVFGTKSQVERWSSDPSLGNPSPSCAVTFVWWSLNHVACWRSVFLSLNLLASQTPSLLKMCHILSTTEWNLGVCVCLRELIVTSFCSLFFLSSSVSCSDPLLTHGIREFRKLKTTIVIYGLFAVWSGIKQMWFLWLI